MEEFTYSPVPNVTERRTYRISKKVCALLIVFTLIVLCMLIAGIVLLVKKAQRDTTVEKNDEITRDEGMDEYCRPSEEAKRIKLNSFLEKCQSLYFKLHPVTELYIHRDAHADELRTVGRKFVPYLPTPEFLKYFADQLSALKEEIKELDADFVKMKPKESQILAEMDVFLDQFMAEVYEIDFYGGDWMFGPNYFCLNRICSLWSDINLFIYYVELSTKEDVEFVIDVLRRYEATFLQYKKNLQLGVKSGMVKSKLSCQAGIHSMKETYGPVIEEVNAYSLLAKVMRPGFTSKLSTEVLAEWKVEHKETVLASLANALNNGFRKPLLDFLDYLQNTHFRHCPPDDVASGVSSLPLDYVYMDGVPEYTKTTTKKMPITNATLNGKELYEKILPRFTTTKLSADEIFDEGLVQLEEFYAQMINATKVYTNESNEEEAVKKMKIIMEADDQWHGQVKFPDNESDENAYRQCNNNENAAKHCPVRWGSIMKWANYMNGVMGMIHPKLNKVFHFTGEKQSVPACPIAMTPHFNPSNGAMFFQPMGGQCNTPTRFGLPFFLEKYGPRFQEWSVNGHEARPGHHIQYQGMSEIFPYPCANGLSSFFHSLSYLTGFVEGWALYGENPVLSHDVNLYKDNLLQKIGMYKWMVWRAVRLIVDTGLHSRKMNRTWALNQFAKYTWDETDFVRKEVTRYMSCPGQATAYMIGRLTILKARKKAEKELGERFNLKDFHYQVLSLGQAPLGYLLQHIDRYISCMKDSTQLYCNYILNPMHKVHNENMQASAINDNTHWLKRRYYI